MAAIGVRRWWVKALEVVGKNPPGLTSLVKQPWLEGASCVEGKP